MSNDSVFNKPGTATALPPRTEAEFLARERQQALRALQQTGRELGETAKELADRHPWVTIGAAAVAGALVARGLSPAPPRSESTPWFADIFKTVAQNSLGAMLAGPLTSRHTHNGEQSLPAP